MPRYTEAEAQAAIASATSWSDALRKLGLRAAGGNHKVLQRWAAEWRISTTHFTPYAHAAAHLRRELIPLESVLVEGSTYTRGSLKRRLFESGLKIRRCEMCGLGERWRGRPMSLILDHVNGVHDDNRLENLRIVCPNCAATLPTHCSRNLPPQLCAGCGAPFRRKRSRQRYCSHACWTSSDAFRAIERRHKVERPPYEQLVAEVEALGWVGVGTRYGVSDNAVRKWIRRYERERAA